MAGTEKSNELRLMEAQQHHGKEKEHEKKSPFHLYE
jgi:hypothetical protein